jgi:hypothetical protein
LNYCQRCHNTILHVSAIKPMQVWRCVDATTLLAGMDPMEQMAECFCCTWRLGSANGSGYHFIDLDWMPKRTLMIAHGALRYAGSGRRVRNNTRHINR